MRMMRIARINSEFEKGKKMDEEIMVLIFAALLEGVEPTPTNCELTERPEEFYRVLRRCQDEGYINGFTLTKGGQGGGHKGTVSWGKNGCLTEKGRQWLKSKRLL